MSDNTKALAAQWTWSPFGVMRQFIGTEEIDLRLLGQSLHAETGLHYDWHRHYDPTNGRYTQAHPMRLVAGVNRNSYVLNNPLQLADSKGLDIDIYLFLEFAWGRGHLAIATNGSTPQDYYPSGQCCGVVADGSLNVEDLGQLHQKIRLQASSAQNAQVNLAILRRILFPGKQILSNNNCSHFVLDALASAGYVARRDVGPWDRVFPKNL